MLLRDLLQHVEELGISKIILLVRPKKSKSGEERIQLMLSSEKGLFRSFSEAELGIIEVVECDLERPNFGLTSHNDEGDDTTVVVHPLLPPNQSISHIIHCAASVRFTQSFHEAASSIITPALQLQNLAREKKAKYVHFSTAFVFGSRRGSMEEPLLEELMPFPSGGDMDCGGGGSIEPMEVYRSMMSHGSLASRLYQRLGFTNTYTFAKWVCEHLLLLEENDSTSTDTIILRPSIVGPSLTCPYAGDKPTTLVAAACLYLKYQYNLWSFGENVTVTVIPVDIVSRYSLCKAFSSEKKTIYNVTWDAAATSTFKKCFFAWDDFAKGLTQAGAAEGFISRFVACLTLFIALRIVPLCRFTPERFAYWHGALVTRPYAFFISVAERCGWCFDDKLVKRWKYLLPFLDLPLLYFTYMNGCFYFSSELVSPPAEMDGEGYMMTCVRAASQFLRRIDSSSSSSSLSQRSTTSRETEKTLFDISRQEISSPLWWCLTQPRGNICIRMMGYFLHYLFQYTTDGITFDTATAILSQLTEKTKEGGHNDHHVILASNHRSLFDFLVLTFIIFALPELGIELPRIVAAEEFSRIPLLGWIARCCGAFFVKRGGSEEDAVALTEMVKRMKEKDGVTVWMVFLEGGRSRDRRFLKPKTGFLRCLLNTGGHHTILPITVNYERLPEQSTFANEVTNTAKTNLTLVGLYTWLHKVITRNVSSIGRIHVTTSSHPIPLPSPKADGDGVKDASHIAARVQQEQQRGVVVSNWHVRAGARVLFLEETVVRGFLLAQGVAFWPSGGDDSEELVELPTSREEMSVIMLHFGHVFATLLPASHKRWAGWLNPCLGVLPSAGTVATTKTRRDSADADGDDATDLVVAALTSQLNEAEQVVKQTLNNLHAKGFNNPKREHVLQYAIASLLSSSSSSTNTISSVFVAAAVAMTVTADASDKIPSSPSSQNPRLVTTTRKTAKKQALFSPPSIGKWGHANSQFTLCHHGHKCVSFTGDKRYSFSGRCFPNLIPFFEKELGLSVGAITAISSSSSPSLSNSEWECNLSSTSLQQLAELTGGEKNNNLVSTSLNVRLAHSSGQAQEEVHLLQKNSPSSSLLRIPDVVIYPQSEEQCQSLIDLASENNWCLVPYGGGTNVSRALTLPSKRVEPRPILSVDMTHMKKILWVNEEDGLMCVQAGMTGGELSRELKKRGPKGYTVGHEPDSYEFSTVGGWVATKSSGMTKSKYGNVEDCVRTVRVCTPRGVLWQGDDGTSNNTRGGGRVSMGLDLTSLMLASEGNWGIITSVVLKIHPLPDVKEYEMVILPSFQVGLDFVRCIARSHNTTFQPASVRLLDNDQFRLGRAMSSDTNHVMSATKLVQSMALAYKGYSPDKIVGVTIVFEGSHDEVHVQKRNIRSLCHKHGGLLAGHRAGKNGYELTSSIAYLRDFAMSSFNILGDSIETFVPWSKIEDLVRRVKRALQNDHSARCLPGRPFISCRISQLYHDGVCVYFYAGASFVNVPSPADTYKDWERLARMTILNCGGSLSHHHGVGKVRGEFMESVTSQGLQQVLKGIKDGMDPNNIFGARNGVFYCGNEDKDVDADCRT